MDIIITAEEAAETIKAYRSAFPEICDYNTGLWSRMNWCAIEAVREEGKVVTLWGTELTFHVDRLDDQRYWLLMTLPSGRHIAYYRPKCDTVNQWGQPVLSFRSEWMGKSYREETFGGRLTENAVQGIARDICMTGALNAHRAGYPLIGTVHDEVLGLPTVLDLPFLPPLKQCLLDLPQCYAGLPLDAEIKQMERYAK